MTTAAEQLVGWATGTASVAGVDYSDVRRAVATLSLDKPALRAVCAQVFASPPTKSESARSMARRLQERIESRLASRDRGAEIARLHSPS